MRIIDFINKIEVPDVDSFEEGIIFNSKIEENSIDGEVTNREIKTPELKKLLNYEWYLRFKLTIGNYKHITIGFDVIDKKEVYIYQWNNGANIYVFDREELHDSSYACLMLPALRKEVTIYDFD